MQISIAIVFDCDWLFPLIHPLDSSCGDGNVSDNVINVMELKHDFYEVSLNM